MEIAFDSGRGAEDLEADPLRSGEKRASDGCQMASGVVEFGQIRAY